MLQKVSIIIFFVCFFWFGFGVGWKFHSGVAMKIWSSFVFVYCCCCCCVFGECCWEEGGSGHQSGWTHAEHSPGGGGSILPISSSSSSSLYARLLFFPRLLLKTLHTYIRRRLLTDWASSSPLRIVCDAMKSSHAERRQEKCYTPARFFFFFFEIIPRENSYRMSWCNGVGIPKIRSWKMSLSPFIKGSRNNQTHEIIKETKKLKIVY